MRIRPDVVINHEVRNQSSRNGQRIELIVVHDTESHDRPGKADLAAIAAWFDNPDAEASAHVCTDGDGHSARMVADAAKAWSCVGFNGRSLNIEQIGFATDPEASWFKRRAELLETARWLARWSVIHGVPLRKGKVEGSGVVRSGVVRHSDLGIVGGGHHDPGGGYPLRFVLATARVMKRSVRR